jgi:hypothetical protein
MAVPYSDFRRSTGPVKYWRFFDIAGATPGRRIFGGVPQRLGAGVESVDGFVCLTAGVVRVSTNPPGAGTSNGIHCARPMWRPIFLCHRNLHDESIFSLAAGSAQDNPFALRPARFMDTRKTISACPGGGYRSTDLDRQRFEGQACGGAIPKHVVFDQIPRAQLSLGLSQPHFAFALSPIRRENDASRVKKRASAGSSQ